jgi:hypothetical protein
MAKDEMLAQIDRSWANLISAIEGLSTDHWGESGVSGEWSVKDLLGHVAFWDRYSAEVATKRGAVPASEVGWQAMNDADAAAKADWTVTAIETELADAHAAILTAYEALPTLDEENVKEDWEHYDEHAAEIRAWREREGI